MGHQRGTATEATRVLGIGELLWDLFPDGPRLGGAPFNVTANLRRLGHPAAFVTAVGDDDLGRAALAAADDLGVDTRFVATSVDLPTGTVDILPDPATGHRFVIGSPAAYESLGDRDALVARIGAWGPDAMVYGTLAQRSPGVRELTVHVATDVGPRHRLYDVNLREGWTADLVRGLLPEATVVKVNDDEAEILGGLLGTTSEPRELGARLATQFGIDVLTITRGADGAVLWSHGELASVEGVAIEVTDTVGAGDAFAAGLLHGLLVGLPARETLSLANGLGALVASRPGALPPWSADDLDRVARI